MNKTDCPVNIIIKPNVFPDYILGRLPTLGTTLIEDCENDWSEYTLVNGERVKKHIFCDGLLKHMDGKCTYDFAIKWCIHSGISLFSGVVYCDDKMSDKISSRQFVNFPFSPTTFYINTVHFEVNPEDVAERTKSVHIGSRYFFLMPETKEHLEEVFSYYNKYPAI